jgi:effector-binding domain-containing protein
MAGFTVFESPVQPTAVVRGTLVMSELPSFFGRAFSAVAAVLNAQGTPPTHEPFAYYPTMPGATIEVEAGFAVDAPIAPSGDVVPSQLPGGTVARGMHVGPYEKLAETYTAMGVWAATQGLTLSGPMWEVYLSDPQQEPDPSTWRTEIFAYAVPAPVAASPGKSLSQSLG